MNIAQRKKELYEKHLHIFQECNKLKENLNIAFERSQTVISTALNISDTDLLKKYTKIYEYLNKLHLELVDVNCKLELYYQNSDTILNNHNESINKLVDIKNNKQYLISNYLNKLEVNADSSTTSSTSSSKAVCSTDSLNENEKSSQDFPNEPKTDNQVKNLNKTSFKEIFDTKSTESSGFFLREINPEESLKNFKTAIDNKSNIMESKNVILEDSTSKEIAAESSLEMADTKSKRRRRRGKKSNQKSVEPSNVEFPKSSSSTNYEQSDIISEEDYNRDILTIPYVRPPKENDMCCMGYVESPSHFYIQLVCKEATYFERFHEEIEKHIDNFPFYYSKLDAKQAFDKYCTCFCEKNHMWYRAKIIDWLIELDDEVLVQFIDFGNTLIVPVTNLRELTKDLYAIPITTFKCKLDGVIPVEGEKWSKDSLQLFFDTVKPTDNCGFKINFLERDGDAFSIDLSTDQIKSIAALMILNGKAKAVYPDCDLESKKIALTNTFKKVSNNSKNTVEIKPGSSKTITLESENTVLTKKEANLIKEHESLQNDLMKEQIWQSKNVSDNDFNSDDLNEDMFSNPTLAVYNYDPVDEKRVCKFLNTKNGCWKGKNCKFSHEPLDPDGWTTDKLPVFYDAFNCIDLPPVGVTARVKVKFIKDLMTFYVHIKSYPDKFNSFYRPANSLKQLSEMMNSELEVKSYKPPMVLPAYGQIILVKRSNKWLRGRVINIDGNDDATTLKVFLVDYGGTISAPLSDTTEIKEQFLHYPFQAIQCVLFNTCVKKNVPEDFIENGLNFLEETLLEKTLNAKIIYTFDDGMRVLLSDENNEDVGEQLIMGELLNRNMDDFLPESNQSRIKMTD